MRPVKQTKQAARKYPNQTHNHDCHQDKPSTIIEDEIIHVFYAASQLALPLHALDLAVVYSQY
jgi:hypothetical protein